MDDLLRAAQRAYRATRSEADAIAYEAQAARASPEHLVDASREVFAGSIPVPVARCFLLHPADSPRATQDLARTAERFQARISASKRLGPVRGFWGEGWEERGERGEGGARWPAACVATHVALRRAGLFVAVDPHPFRASPYGRLFSEVLLVGHPIRARAVYVRSGWVDYLVLETVPAEPAVPEATS